MSEWISVYERLPEIETDVLGLCNVQDKQLTLIVSREIGDGEYWFSPVGFNGVSYDEVVEVTHWQPLPKLPKKVPEVIVCAAVKFIERTQREINLNRNGVELIVPMVRHYSPDGREYSPDGREVLESIKSNCELKELEKGFITNKGRFVDMVEALKIAKENNQIKFDIGYNTKFLFSEMLY